MNALVASVAVLLVVALCRPEGLRYTSLCRPDGLRNTSAAGVRDGIVTAVAPAIGTQPRRVSEELGVSGYVLEPDGNPVSGGTIVAQSSFIALAESIDSTGHFRLVPPRPGFHQFTIRVPGWPAYRFTVDVPASRAVRLPAIRLVAGAFFRVRLVSAEGEPITAPRLRRRLFDASGQSIVDEAGDRLAEAAASDGTVTIGPLPRAVMTLAVDMPLFAQTRLPDVNVADATKNLDGGTIVIQQPGTVLHVDLVDEEGAAVANHDVLLEDTRARSPLAFQPVRTNHQGRATFDRLATGRYRVWTTAVNRCANVTLATSRVVAASGSGTIAMPIVVGGRATFRITSPLGPMKGIRISASPNVPTPPSFPFRGSPFGCRGATDGSGRVTLTNFPPGPAHVDVAMANSMYVHQVDVPIDGHEVVVAIPDGFAQVHVINAIANQPVGGAAIAWTGGGARVEATATAAGDALLEGVGTAAGTLTVSARGYEPAQEELNEPPGVTHTVALTPLRPTRNLLLRVGAASGEPIANAVVQLITADPTAVLRIATADAKGVVRFSGVPAGSLQVIASAEGFVTSMMRLSEERMADAVFALARGYRVIAASELPATAGPQRVHVLNDADESMDAGLDSESPRRIDTPGRFSLGPLGPGAYVIELDGASGRRQEHIRIVDRDVSLTFR